MAPEDRAIEKKKYLAQVLSRLGLTHDSSGQPLGSGPPNRHGKPRLPVGQHEVKHWPVLDLGSRPELDASTWSLRVDGLVERPTTYTWDSFLALPQVEDVSDFHCVTTWSRMDNRWKGVRFRTIALQVGVLPQARFVLVTGWDRAPGSGEHYTTNISLDDALTDDVLLVHEWEGRPLPPEHGGPVRMITPRLYAWKGAKWIKGITFLADDHPGFWEVRGYSNTARPWENDRHSR
jgi:DMSO/TMAO reductase YedYZ molybdopterin-dependent catalytic subunit